MEPHISNVIYKANIVIIMGQLLLFLFGRSGTSRCTSQGCFWWGNICKLIDGLQRDVSEGKMRRSRRCEDDDDAIVTLAQGGGFESALHSFKQLLASQSHAGTLFLIDFELPSSSGTAGETRIRSLLFLFLWRIAKVSVAQSLPFFSRVKGAGVVVEDCSCISEKGFWSFGGRNVDGVKLGKKTSSWFVTFYALVKGFAKIWAQRLLQ